MANKNVYLSQLTGDATYTQIVFNKVWGKVEAERATYPEKKVFMMAFGDTSQPLPPTVVRGSGG